MENRMATLREIEKRIILKRLKLHNYNRTHTARSLGVGIRTVQRKLKEYGCEGIGLSEIWQRRLRVK
jgi:DNA-binding NtrC family response regulator